MKSTHELFQAPPEIIQWLRNLSDKQLVEFFYQAVEERRISHDGEHYHQEHLVLANASRLRESLIPESEELGPWQPWELQLLALYDPEHSSRGWVDDAPICQSGGCECKQIEVLCYDKHAICPVCGAPVFCT